MEYIVDISKMFPQISGGGIVKAGSVVGQGIKWNYTSFENSF